MTTHHVAPRRGRLRSALALAALALLLPTAQADTWPSRPLKLIVPFPPGGAADAVGRIYAEKLSEALKQPIVIDSKPGAGSAIGGDIAAKAAPDGYTLSLAPAGQLTVPAADLAAELAVIARQPDLRKRLADLGLDTLNSTPAQFAALIRSDHAKWGEVIQRAGIRSD